MKKGKIIEISGPVVDCEFEAGQLPRIKEALKVSVEGKIRVMEVAHIGQFMQSCFVCAGWNKESGCSEEQPEKS